MSDLINKFVDADELARLSAEVVAERAPKPPAIKESLTLTDFGKELAETKEVEQKLCPACGHDLTSPDDVQVSPQDKRNWVRHVLFSTPYKQTYTMFDGLMSVTFRTRTVVENEAIIRTLATEHDKLAGFGPMSLSRDPAYVARMYRLEVCASLDTIITVDPESGEQKRSTFGSIFAPEYTPEPGGNETNVAIAYRKRMNNMPEALMSGLVMRYGEFTDHVNTLMRKGRVAGFWKPTAFAG
jgi:hypothetical protein